MQLSYVKCTDLSQAVHILQEQESVYLLAGGTDLVVGIRSGKLKPKVILDIKDIAGLNILQENEAGLTIGAAASLNNIVSFITERKLVPILAEGCHSIGTFSIRNRGTLVGNVCNASPAADTAPALYCLGAKVKIIGPAGSRVVPIESFFAGPGKTVLQKGELVTSVLIPRPFPSGKGIYQKASRTMSVDLATVGVAIQKWQDEVVIAINSVAPTPVRAKSVEQAVNKDKVVDFTQAAKLVRKDIAPITDLRGSHEFRCHLAEALIHRGLAEIMEV